MKKILVTLLIMILASSSTAGTINKIPNPKPIFSREELRYYVNENAKNLPLQTDAITTITGILLGSNNTILWRYRFDKEGLINFHAKSENMNVKGFIKAVNRKYGSINNYLDSWKINVMNQYISNRNCSTPAVRRFLDGGISIKHSYHDMEGLQFHEVTVTVDSCK